MTEEDTARFDFVESLQRMIKNKEEIVEAGCKLKCY